MVSDQINQTIMIVAERVCKVTPSTSSGALRSPAPRARSSTITHAITGWTNRVPAPHEHVHTAALPPQRLACVCMSVLRAVLRSSVLHLYAHASSLSDRSVACAHPGSLQPHASCTLPHGGDPLSFDGRARWPFRPSRHARTPFVVA